MCRGQGALHASTHFYDPMNAGIREKVWARIWIFLNIGVAGGGLGGRESDINDTMECEFMSLAISAQLLEVKDEIIYLGSSYV